MSSDREEQFRNWAKPPGHTEQDRCDNAVSAIRNAIKRSDKLSERHTKVIVHGSYRNNTNVRKDSDVDIGIICEDSFFYDLPDGLNADSVGIIPSSYHYNQFKDEVEEALVNYFGSDAIKRGNKAFDVHETSYHVEADVAAFFEYRLYMISKEYDEGVALLTDKENRKVINWPEQHYENGTNKNTKTGTRFKSIVRILKTLSNEMTEKGVRAGDIPGFLIECLVWNVPNTNFGNETYTNDLEKAIVFLYKNTDEDEKCRKWVEVSELKYLFHNTQQWTREQAHKFTVAAWGQAGFGE